MNDMTITDFEVVDMPSGPHAIEPEWLTGILRKSGVLVGNHVASVKLSPTTAGFGAICTTARIEIAYDQDEPTAPKSLFAKFSTEQPWSVVSTKAEVRFYREIAGHLRLSIPRCYFAASYENHHLLLLEDISTGYGGDSLLGTTTTNAMMIVQEIAAFHARWWEPDIPPNRDWLREGPEVGENVSENFRNAWPRFRARHEDSLNAYVKTTCDNAVERVPELFAIVTGSPRTLLHGDVQLDNVRFGASGHPPVFLDWGNVAIGTAARDLAWFLTRSLPVVQRRADGEQLIRAYHDALLGFGVDYPLAEFHRHMKICLTLFFFVVAQASFAADYSSDRGASLHAEFIHRGAAAIEDFRTGEIFE